MKTQTSSISDYLSLVKFSHTVFALPFAAIGFLLGAKSINFEIDIFLVLKVLLCMITARNAAMSFNRWTDKEFDAKNPRTAIREIPAGIIKADSALWFTIINAVAFITICFFINPHCFFLSPIALLVILGYSYTKRFTALCHIILGIGLGLAPVGAYLAVTGSFAPAPVLVGIAVLCWVSGFDIIYALQDDVFDKQHNLYSVPSIFGRKKALRISELLHLLSAAFLFTFLYVWHASWIAYAGWAIFSLLLIYQHTLVKENDLSKVNVAFATSNGIASLVFACFIITDLMQ
jgi:4-hydroxybenzoate polyprenyltransferase